MPISALNKALLGKIETTPGTDAVPVPATDAVRLATASLTVDGAPIEYDVVKQTFGKMTGPYIGKQLQLDVEFYVRSGGGLGVLPDWAAIAHAAAHTVTSILNTSVRLSPITAVATRHTSTFHFYEDGLLFKLVGAVCSSFSMDAPLDGLLKCKASIIAPFATPTAAALPTGLVYQSSQPIRPRPADVVTDGGVALKIGSFAFDTSIAATVRQLIGGSDALVTGRDHPKITFTKDSLGTVADYTRIQAVTGAAFSAVLGVAGNQITLTAPNAKYGSLKSSENNTVEQRDVELWLDETVGDDAYSIVIA